MEPVLLRGCCAALWRLDFYRGEDGHLLAHHVGRDRDSAQADEISGSFGEAELHGAASARIWECAGVVAE